MELFIEHFHFLRPLMWLLLIPLVWLFYRVRSDKASLASWSKIVEPQLLSYLQSGKSTRSQSKGSLLLLLAGILMIAALAGPVWLKMEQPVYSDHSAVVVALDLSRSMDAADIKPSRLIRAKQKLVDLLHARKEGDTALIVFAASAFVVTPLTDDEETILSQLQGLTTDIMPAQGGNIDAALIEAQRLFAQAGVRNGKVLLLTDSERYSEAQVEALTKAGHRLFVVGVGSREGAPIAKPQGGFVSDRSGNIVVAQLDEQKLSQLALMGSGSFATLSLDNRDIEPVLGNGLSDQLQRADDDKAENGQTSDEWVEEGPWLLLPAMLLLLPIFRRGLLVITLLMLVQPQDVRAVEWQDLWSTSDQQGEALMQDGKFAEAAEKFDDPAWKAAAAYKEKDYSKALQQYNKLEYKSIEDKYNMANTLAQMGKLDGAISLYDEVLQENPEHEDAKANKALLEKMKQQQESQEQDSQQQSEQQSSDQQQGEQSQQEQSQNSQNQDGGDSSETQQNQQSGEQQDQQNSESQSGQSQAEQSEQQQASDAQSHQEADKQEQQAAQANKAEQDESGQDNEMKAAQQADQKEEGQSMEELEARQAFEQQLRRIPDDPGGLLRRKFKYQYQQGADRQNRGAEEQW